MDDAEIESMSRLEGAHWWYRGLRDVIGQTLTTEKFELPPSARILDAGCGTGETLCYLRELLKPSYLGGFDKSPRAVELCQKRAGPTADVYIGDVCEPVVHTNSLDLIISCDVISITGTGACLTGLRRLVSALAAGGLFIMNLPALRWLRSGHDIITHTCERFDVPTTKRLLTELGLRLEFLSYRMFWLFPAMMLRRLPTILVRPTFDNARSDLKPTRTWLNESLYRVMRMENWMLRQGATYPWGSSIFVVGRKERLP